MESPPRKLPPKKDVLEAFLGNGSARVFLDPRRTGVLVPKWFLKQAELVLRVGHSLSPPIPDLLVTDEAVSCTLSFNRSPFWCKMPWNAVFAVVSDVDGRGVVWPDDVPVESQLLKPARPKPKLASVAPPEEPAAKTEPDTKDADASDQAAVEKEAPEVAPAAAARDAGDIAAADSTSEGRPEAAPEEPSASEGEAGEGSSETAQGKKPKRQLPPYLRVVK